MKVNAVFVPPGDDREEKPFCFICRQYYQSYPDGMRCPVCGDNKKPITPTNKTLKADDAQPLIAHKKVKNPHDADLPKGAVWISDDEV